MFLFSYLSADPTAFVIYSTSNNELQQKYFRFSPTCVIGTIYTLHWYGNPFQAPILSPDMSTVGGGMNQSNYLYTPTRNAYLFSVNTPSGFGGTSREMRIYSFQVEGKLNLVPAKNSSGVVGMYDTVTNTFKTNAGSGTFVAGAEIGIASTSYVAGMHEAINTTKQNKLTSTGANPNVIVTGDANGIVSSFTANNGIVTVTRSEITIPWGGEHATEQAEIWTD